MCSCVCLWGCGHVTNNYDAQCPVSTLSRAVKCGSISAFGESSISCRTSAHSFIKQHYGESGLLVIAAEIKRVLGLQLRRSWACRCSLSRCRNTVPLEVFKSARKTERSRCVWSTFLGDINSIFENTAKGDSGALLFERRGFQWALHLAYSEILVGVLSADHRGSLDSPHCVWDKKKSDRFLEPDPYRAQ